MLYAKFYIAILAMVFPILLLAQVNPTLQNLPAQSKTFDKLQNVKMKTSPVRLTDVSFNRDIEGWKYYATVSNPKKENLKLEVYAKHSNSKFKLIDSVAMTQNNIVKVFENLYYRKLKIVLLKHINGARFEPIDSKYLILPVLKATITDINVRSEPPHWSFILRSDTTVPMKFAISVLEIEGPTNHGIANYRTPLLQPGQTFKKENQTGYLRVGNKFEVSVRDIPTQAVITKQVIEIQ